MNTQNTTIEEITHINNAKVLMNAILILLNHNEEADVVDVEAAYIEMLQKGKVDFAFEDRPEGEKFWEYGLKATDQERVEYALDRLKELGF